MQQCSKQTSSLCQLFPQDCVMMCYSSQQLRVSPQQTAWYNNMASEIGGCGLMTSGSPDMSAILKGRNVLAVTGKQQFTPFVQQ